jgi:site-specific DNA recombinase
VQRWNLPDGWVISSKPAHPALVSEADFIAAQDISAARGLAAGTASAPPGKRRYLLAGLLACGICGRRMESAWSNGKPAYRCRHGHTSATLPHPRRAKNAYVREERVLARLPATYLMLTGAESATRRRRRTRCGVDLRHAISPEEAIGFLREHQITLIWDPAADTAKADTSEALKNIAGRAS